jgi:NAD(P)-dependent dehydrogenase (short-subunit alcohol dehydrogenase family)
MTIRFDNRVAIVTGAGNGLGRAHALLLASRGARVVVNDPGGAVDGKGGDHAAADKVVAEIKAAGGQAVPNYDSVADPKSAANIVKTAVDSFGTIDIVVNNAGVLRDKTFHNMTVDDFDFVVKVHFLGTPMSRTPRGPSCAPRPMAGSWSPRRTPASTAISARRTMAAPSLPS